MCVVNNTLDAFFPKLTILPIIPELFNTGLPNLTPLLEPTLIVIVLT